MTYDFDNVPSRRGTNSVKWDINKADDFLPLWVADMDFPVAPAIHEALKRRIEHGVFGYTLVPDSFYDAIISWQQRRHDFHVEREWILYIPGVVPATSCAIKSLTTPGEKVLVQTPVYNCFFSSIRNQGCQVAENRLVRRGDTYEIDFDDFERQCADEKTTVFLLCNPHNPAGRAWTREELLRMNDICLRHGVTVISDEIHSDLTMPGHRFTPFASISDECRDNSITLNSPTKSFNFAGLQIAYIICPDKERRRKIDRWVNIFEVCDVNPFGVIALEAAYNDCEEWLNELTHYIYDNYLYLQSFISEHMPQLKVLRLEATYLAWLDISALGISSTEAYRRLLADAHLMLNDGTLYGSAGEGYLRINLACTRDTLEEALKRLQRALI